jgi:colanic acid/amylovoran biosynthesis glycosyltransferase
MERRGGSGSHDLVVFAPLVGARTETFIRRHARDLLPGKTIVVANEFAPERDWLIDGPVLITHARPSRRDRWRAARLFRSLGARVLLGEYLDCSLPWLEIGNRAGLDVFVHAHGYDVSSALRKPELRPRYLEYKRASGVVTMSEASRHRLVEFGFDERRVHVVPYGVDVPESLPVKPSSDGCVRCLAVGRMVRKKAPLTLIRAFAAAAARVPELRLDLVGDGPLLPAVLELVDDSGLREQVVIHGSQPNAVVKQLLAEADIFVQHSVVDVETGDAEGLPVAILEAMAQGLAVLATRHEGIAEAIEDGINGQLVEEHDWITMAGRLVELSRDRRRRLELGRAAWHTAKARYAWPSQRLMLLDVLGLHPRS